MESLRRPETISLSEWQDRLNHRYITLDRKIWRDKIREFKLFPSCAWLQRREGDQSSWRPFERRVTYFKDQCLASLLRFACLLTDYDM